MYNKQQYDNNYQKENYDRIIVLSKKGLKDLAKDRAKDLDKSLSQYIVDLILEDLDKRE